MRLFLMISVALAFSAVPAYADHDMITVKSKKPKLR